MKTSWFGWAAVFAAAFGITTSQASEATKTQPSNSTEAPVRAESGMRAYVDPETGQLTNTPVTDAQRQQAAADNLMFREDDLGLVEIHKADGSSMIRLEGRYQQATVAQISTDGQLETYCSDADHLQRGKHVHAMPVAASRDER